MKKANLNLSLRVKENRNREFFELMGIVVPWRALIDLIATYLPEVKKGTPSFSLATMLRTDFLQQSFFLSAPGMEQAIFDVSLYRKFTKFHEFSRMPDKSTILRFRHRLKSTSWPIKFRLSQRYVMPGTSNRGWIRSFK